MAYLFRNVLNNKGVKMKKFMFFLVITMLLVTACGKKVETPTTEEVINEELVSAPEVQAPQTPEIVQPQIAGVPTSQPSASEGVVLESAATKTLALEKPTVTDIQKALKSAGLYAGKVDGSLGPKTKKAIEEFQKQNKLKVDGKVGPKTWEKLKTYLK
jgi:peptidoglycan hydrolase-like protein with peptidoglycan-binding domain